MQCYQAKDSSSPEVAFPPLLSGLLEYVVPPEADLKALLALAIVNGLLFVTAA